MRHSADEVARLASFAERLGVTSLRDFAGATMGAPEVQRWLVRLMRGRRHMHMLVPASECSAAGPSTVEALAWGSIIAASTAGRTSFAKWCKGWGIEYRGVMNKDRAMQVFRDAQTTDRRLRRFFDDYSTGDYRELMQLGSEAFRSVMRENRTGSPAPFHPHSPEELAEWRSRLEEV